MLAANAPSCDAGLALRGRVRLATAIMCWEALCARRAASTTRARLVSATIRGEALSALMTKEACVSLAPINGPSSYAEMRFDQAMRAAHHVSVPPPPAGPGAVKHAALCGRHTLAAARPCHLVRGSAQRYTGRAHPLVRPAPATMGQRFALV